MFEFTIIDAYNYDVEGSAPRSNYSHRTRCHSTRSSKPDDVGLPGVLDTMHRLTAGDLAHNVMLTPTALA